MSQLALYRRYRPETFAEVIGQEHVTGPLQQALRNNRVNHAYLFSGPRGCGKTTSARILARCLNCEQGPTPTPCGECRSCQDLSRNGPGSIDVIEIDAASHGGVDDARELREKAFFGPAASRYKIYIIDEAHMVTSAGFNALLKVVEEPPEHLKFIFATTEPEKVIGTIRSRTHHYPFRLVPPGTLREYLAEVCERESIPVEEGVLPLVVRAGAGSVRDSMSVMDQLLAGAAADGVTYAMATALLGYTDSALLDPVVDAFAAGDGGAAFEVVDRVIEGGGDPRRFVADLLERLRDLVILAAVPDAGEKGLIDVPEDVLERMRAQATAFGAAELSRAADLVNEGLTEMRGATSPRLQLELICARVLLPAAYGDERSVQARLDRLERGQAAAPAAPGVGYAPGPEAQPPGPAAARAAIAERGGPVVPGSSGEDARGAAGRQGADSQNVQAGGSQAPQAQDGGSRNAVSRGAGRQDAGPEPEGAGQQDVRGAGPQGGDPQGVDRQGTGSQGTGSQDTGPQSVSPHDAAPHDAAPQHPGPQHPGPQSAGAQSSAPAPRPESVPGEGHTGAQPGPDARQGAAPARRPGAWPTTAAAGGGGTGQSAGPAAGQSTPPAAPRAAHTAQGAPQANPQAGAASVRQMWPEILEAVKNRRRFTWILLSQNAQVSGFDGSTLQLGFANPGARDSFAGGGSAEVLQEALAEKFGVQWKVEAIVDPSGGGGGAQQPPPGASPVRQPMQTAPPRPEATRPPAPESYQAPPPRSYDEPEPPPPLEEDMPAEDDPDLDDTALSGHDLIVRELGATVIEEIRNEQ